MHPTSQETATSLAETPSQPPQRWGELLGVFLVFWGLYAISGALRWTPYNAHVHLANAILHGSFALIDPPQHFEMTHVSGHSYVAYGIAPSLLMLPFVAVFGLGFHQALFSAALGAIAVALWHDTLPRIGVAGQARYWLTALFGAGSLFWFYSGQSGNTWAMMHVVAVLGLMLAIHETLGKQRGWLVGLGFGLAVLSRQPVLLSLPFFAGMLWRDDRAAGGKSFWHKGATFAAALGALLAFNAFYNAARFGTPFDNGYKRVIFDTTPSEFLRWGIFHLNYFAQEFHGYFLKLPQRLPSFPWFDPSMDGFSIFLSLPALVFALKANYRKRLDLLALAACLGILAMYLFYYWSGYAQFGRRYSVDFLPFCMLLIASGTRGRVTPWLVAVTLAGALVQLWGLFWWGFKGW